MTFRRTLEIIEIRRRGWKWFPRTVARRKPYWQKDGMRADNIQVAYGIEAAIFRAAHMNDKGEDA